LTYSRPSKVWHEGLLYKLKSKIAQPTYLVLKSYLNERYFQVKIEDKLSNDQVIKAGGPQGSVIKPLLYLIYTADAPTWDDTLIATFADDTAIVSSDEDPARASERLYHHIRFEVSTAVTMKNAVFWDVNAV
jgi:hypothetical protein